jgi:hypothetical protein
MMSSDKFDVDVIDDQTELARKLLFQLENAIRDFVKSKISDDTGRIKSSFLKGWESSRKKESFSSGKT